MKLYDRRNIPEMKDLENIMRCDPTNMDKVYVRLEKDIILHATKPRAMLNTYLFEVFEDFHLDMKLRKKFIFRGDYRKGALDAYMNAVIDDIHGTLDNAPVMMPHLLADMFSCFHRLAAVAGERFSMDHSLVGYLRAYIENKEFADLFKNPRIKKTMNPWAVEREYKGIMDTIERANIHPLSDFIKSGVKANSKQIMAMVQVGLQPDYLDPGRVKNLTTSGFLDGINNLEDMFHLDNGSLEATIKGKSEVQEPGEIGKHMTVALSDTKLNKDVTRETVHDCKTHDYLVDTIKSKADLKHYRYRYYVDPTSHDILGYVDLDRTDLIGKVLHMREICMCKLEGHICEVCAGANYKFLQDTAVYKNNLSEYIGQEIARVAQGVISIKHSNSANLKSLPVTYMGIDYKCIEDFVNAKPDLFERFEFDKLYCRPGVKLEMVETEGKTFGTIMINDEPLIMHDKPQEIEDLMIHLYIPNDSVLLDAKKLKIMLGNHSNHNSKSKKLRLRKEDLWDTSNFKNMTRAEQIQSFYNYCRTMIKLPHSLYYAGIVHALIRDADDLSQRPTEQTERVTAIYVKQILSAADKINNMSSKIHHGYFRDNVLAIVKNTQPTEADVLYNVITDRNLSEANTTEKLWEIMMSGKTADCSLGNEYCNSHKASVTEETYIEED